MIESYYFTIKLYHPNIINSYYFTIYYCINIKFDRILFILNYIYLILLCFNIIHSKIISLYYFTFIFHSKILFWVLYSFISPYILIFNPTWKWAKLCYFGNLNKSFNRKNVCLDTIFVLQRVPLINQKCVHLVHNSLTNSLFNFIKKCISSNFQLRLKMKMLWNMGDLNSKFHVFYNLKEIHFSKSLSF